MAVNPRGKSQGGEKNSNSAFLVFIGDIPNDWVKINGTGHHHHDGFQTINLLLLPRSTKYTLVYSAVAVNLVDNFEVRDSAG